MKSQTKGFILMVTGALLITYGVALYADPRLFLILIGAVFYLVGVDNYLLPKMREEWEHNARRPVSDAKQGDFARKGEKCRP